jgi:hypothetical protein
VEECVKIILRETGRDDLYEFMLWEPTTTHLQANYQLLVYQHSRAKRVLADQHRPWQCKYPLGQALLAVANKDDHIMLSSQFELLLLYDSIWSARGNSNPPIRNAANRLGKRSPRPFGSTLPALSTLWPARSHKVTEHGRTTVTDASQPNVARASHRHSSGIYVVVPLYTGNSIPQRVSDPNQIVLNDILQYSLVSRDSHNNNMHLCFPIKTADHEWLCEADKAFHQFKAFVATGNVGIERYHGNIGEVLQLC